MTWRAGGAAARLHADALVWDQHGCLPLDPGTDLAPLERYRDAGASFVSINVGFDPIPFETCVTVLASFRRGILADDEQRFVLARTTADIHRARRDGKLAVAFDLEGTEPLGGQPAMVSAYYELGVRTMLIAYNHRNRAGGGCHDDDDPGLTDLGRAIVAEMNAVGMVVDATHCSYRTSMELFERSSSPVIFSHSNPRALRDHERNVLDEQIRACAATGGVVGINGVGIFLGENDSRTATVVDHIDHVVDLVGPEHVGLGLDYVFDQAELNRYLRENPELFPAGKGYTGWDHYGFVEPERLPDLTACLLGRGYEDDDVRRILGGNFLRVAESTWR